MKKSPAFQFYPDEWLTDLDVILMTPEQEGAYIRLICLCWLDNDLSIPDDDDQLSVLSRINKGGLTKVKAKFKPHPTKPGFLTHSRLQKEGEKQEKWRKKSAEGGRKAQKNRVKDPDDFGQDIEKEEENKGGSRVVQPKADSPSPSPIVEDTTVSSPPLPPKGGKRAVAVPEVFLMADGTFQNFDGLFERLWTTYPKIRDRGHKGQAKDELRKKIKEGENHETIERGVSKYRRYCDSTGEKQPDMFRWIRDKGWERDYDLPSAPQANAGRNTGYSLESALRFATTDQTRRPEGRAERLKNLGLDDDPGDV